jgi:hypothetical protein
LFLADAAGGDVRACLAGLDLVEQSRVAYGDGDHVGGCAWAAAGLLRDFFAGAPFPKSQRCHVGASLEVGASARIRFRAFLTEADQHDD